ncbi:putative cinnamyl alcohol dehydrogenase 9 [Canna indica]|uniref:cinnamyl-alcohol dehydrogenase n=1 Tax=Canna indica TaxID=4628 RepID=A0AAQ3K6D7_9LILI|nr:putative cinnamyl alcohol dehydrogenase 9 [Canna indica]
MGDRSHYESIRNARISENKKWRKSRQTKTGCALIALKKKESTLTGYATGKHSLSSTLEIVMFSLFEEKKDGTNWDRNLRRERDMAREEQILGWAARDTTGVLSPFIFPKRATKGDDITLKILYCGICHSDLCTIKNEWRNARYPVVPGHEVIGVVIEVGHDAHKFKIDDKVGVGYLASACLSCENCSLDYENYCRKRVCCFNASLPDGTKTYGGFSSMMVINEHYAVKIPENLPLEKVAPMLCAGITVYAPLKHHGLDQAGKHLGVLGLGGLGHLAVKFGKAYGMRVTVISSRPEKKKEAIEELGADSFIVSNSAEQMKAAMGTMDGILNTSSGPLSLRPLLSLLKTYGKLILVGSPIKPPELPVFDLLSEAKTITGSMIGGMEELQEMIDFASEQNIIPQVEIVAMDYVNTAMERLEKGDVRFRFVIDVANTIHST